MLLNDPSDGLCTATENPNVVSRTCNAKGFISTRVFQKNIRTLFPNHLRPGILVLDDLMRDCGEDQHVLDLFTKGSHHNDVTCIYLTKNLFPPGKYARTISLNRWWPSKTRAMLWVFTIWRNRRSPDASRMSWIVLKMPPVNPTGTCSLISIPPRPIYFVFKRIFYRNRPSCIKNIKTSRCQQQHRMTMMILERSWLTVPPQPP